MDRPIFFGLLVTALLLGTGALTVYPLTAAAQQPQDPQLFGMRMSARIDAVQMRIKALENELTGGETRERGSSDYEAGGGLLGQLEDLDQQCRELERELDSMGLRSMGFPSRIYEQQREVEYYVWALERQLQQIRRWMHPAEDETESSVEERSEIDTEEDGISDEDWAADWATSDP